MYYLNPAGTLRTIRIYDGAATPPNITFYCWCILHSGSFAVGTTATIDLPPLPAHSSVSKLNSSGDTSLVSQGPLAPEQFMRLKMPLASGNGQ